MYCISVFICTPILIISCRKSITLQGDTWIKGMKERELSNFEICHQIQLGESSSLRIFLNRNQNVVYQHILVNVHGDASLVEDVYLQAISEFAKTILDYSQINNSIENCQAFLITIAKRRAKDAVRAAIANRKKEEALTNEYEVNSPGGIGNADPSQLIELDSDNKKLRECLKELKDDERDMLLMWGNNCTTREIGSRFNCSHSKIVRLINEKLLPRLRKCIEGDER